MARTIKRILEEIDNVFPEGVDEAELENRYGSDVIRRLFQNGFVSRDSQNIDNRNSVKITERGYSFLWLGKMSEALKKMDSTIKSFDKESRKSSENMWKLTIVITVFTVIMGIIAIFGLARIFGFV